MDTQLGWLKDLGFVEVDCYWKWLEIALLIGYKALEDYSKCIVVGPTVVPFYQIY